MVEADIGVTHVALLYIDPMDALKLMFRVAEGRVRLLLASSTKRSKETHTLGLTVVKLLDQTTFAGVNPPATVMANGKTVTTGEVVPLRLTISGTESLK
jgi:hypothetical protein